MRRPRCLLLLCAGAVLSVGCLPDFVPASELGEEPQVIVVRASAPEAAPGETVTFDALVHWPAGTVSLTWLVCTPDPEDEADTCVANRLEDPAAVPRCEDEPLAQLCVASRDATASYRIPSLTLPDDEPRTLFVELVVGGGGGGGGDSLDACAEAVRTVAPTESCLLAVKGLEVSLSGAPNRNPGLTTLEVDGEPVDATIVVIESGGVGLEELQVTLSVSASPASVDELDVGEGEEPVEWVRLPVAWYTTCGSYDDDAGGVRCDPPGPGEAEPTCQAVEARWSPITSGDCEVHVVLRDGRGGAAYTTQRFEVR
ncbi:MAG: hypothetical protein ABI333_02415 [bacterium]